jgi:transcriptional regulator with XRE-family HTH domain
MPSSFGARLRQHRERQGIALSTIAEKTKIKQSLLDGLERDDLSQWPPGIFRRAYVRSYGQAVGLDPDTVVRDFLERYPEPVEPVEPPPPTVMQRLVGVLARSRRDDDIQPAVATPAEPARPPIVVEAPARIPDETAPTMGRTRAAVEVAPPPPAVPTARPCDVDLLAAAKVCTELGRVAHASQVEPLLGEAARILDARGVIVWVWDAIAAELRPALVHGYSDRIRAQLPCVKRDADNVTAAAFRLAQPMAINGRPDGSGALAVPLLTPAACAGVLAIELPYGAEELGPVRAVATFFAAMLAQLVVGDAEPAPEPQPSPP